MPEIGEIRIGTEVGLKWQKKMIFSACVDCGKTRWVQCKAGKAKSPRCNLCSNRTKKYPDRSGSKSSSWRGGNARDGNGYLKIWVTPDHQFYSMATNKNKCGNAYIKSHRLIVAQFLGRPLKHEEQVHHKNGIRSDNRIENLEIVGCGEHTVKHNKGYIDGFEQGRIEGKEAEIKERLEIVRKESFNQGFMAGELKSVKEENYEMSKQMRLLLLTVKNKFGD